MPAATERIRLMKLKIIAIARHRNGIDGVPFHVAIFDEEKSANPEVQGRKVGIVFDEPHHCAVLDIAKLAAGDIAFTSNSWRGDQYEPYLRKAINAGGKE
jgi:hypothetical protein